jgi:hypothetical protein
MESKTSRHFVGAPMFNRIANNINAAGKSAEQKYRTMQCATQPKPYYITAAGPKNVKCKNINAR